MGDEDDRIKHAADDPTAMWDEGSLEAAGFQDLAKKKKADEASHPLPQSQGVGPIETAKPQSQGVGPIETAKPQSQRGRPLGTPSGLSWAVTVALAVAVGAVVYFLVRFLR